MTVIQLMNILINMPKIPFKSPIMNDEQKYINAFNNGYLLEAHEPELLYTIVQNLIPNNNYLEGLFAGKSQFNYERAKIQLLTIGALRMKSKEQNRELGR